MIGRNWQKRNYHREKGQESRKNEITYICNVYRGGGKGGWGDGEGCMGNIWERLELIGPGLGPGPDLHLDPDLRPGVGREG